MSLPEVLLWQELQKRPGGYRFRKQFPQPPYAIDFACLSARLAIEVDGEAHNRGDNPHRDMIRDKILAERGFKTLRLSAYEVLKNMESCVMAIVEACREAGPPPPSLPKGQFIVSGRPAGQPKGDGPPPRSGEDFS